MISWVVELMFVPHLRLLDQHCILIILQVDSVFGRGATFRFFIEATTAPPIGSSVAIQETTQTPMSTTSALPRAPPELPSRSLSSLQ